MATTMAMPLLWRFYRRADIGQSGPTSGSIDPARTIDHLLAASGWLEVGLGTGHSVVATLILERPALAAPIVAAMRWPRTILLPIDDPIQRDLVVGMSLGAGTAWVVFGALLIWQSRTRATAPCAPLLRLVLLHQASFALLLLVFVRWHVLAVAVVGAMVAMLWRALVLIGRLRGDEP
jgi:hypothetical protein